MARKFPPFMNAYGKIAPIFDAIRKASVPDKFTYNFLETVLGFKSSSDRAVMPLLKRLEFLTQDGAPTELYKKFRHREDGPIALAGAIKKAYSDLYLANEYAERLNRKQIEEIIRTKTGAAGDSNTVTAAAGTFDELCKLARFDGAPLSDDLEEKDVESGEKDKTSQSDNSKMPIGVKTEGGELKSTKFGISYTINLNLPATTDIEVFNAIFKSLKEHLIYE